MRMKTGKVLCMTLCMLAPAVAFAAPKADQLRESLMKDPKIANDFAVQEALLMLDDAALEKLAERTSSTAALNAEDQLRAAIIELAYGDARPTKSSKSGPAEGTACDTCATATACPIGEGTFNGDTNDNTDSGIAITCGNSSATPDEFWEYTAGCTGIATADTIGTGADTILAVFDNTCSTPNIACDDDGGPGLESLLSWSVTSGNTYHIYVSGWGGGTLASYTLNVSCVTPVCGDGTVQSGEECDDGNTANGDGCSANCLVEGACCHSDGSCTTDDGTTCTAPGDDYQGDGTDCGSVTCSVCGDGTVGPGEECDDGNTANGDGCDSVCEYEPPVNDDCTAAIPLATPSSGGTVSATGTTNGATNEALPFCGTSQTIGGVWYEVTGTGNGFTATTCNVPPTNYDTKLTVWCPDCATLNCVGGNDDGSPLGTNPDPACVVPETGSTFNRASTVSWCSEAGKTYLIMVHGFSSATGDFELTVTDNATPCATPPACGFCGDSTCDANEDSCNCPADCGPPAATETSCTDGVDNDCDTFIDCADADCPLVGSETGLCTNGADDDCDTAVDCADADCAADPACLPPPNDECATATPVTDGSTPFDNTNATLSPETVCDTNMTASDVWFVYNATCTGIASIEAGCNDAVEPDTVLEVDSGTCGALVLEGCADDTCGTGSGFASNVDISVTSGNDYYIRISGWNGGTVSGTLDISCVTPICGNGTIEPGEQCDDGNTADGDGCDSNCQVEPICSILNPANCQLPDQLGHGAAGTVGATSDANVGAGFAVADNFTATATGNITEVCWWGFYVDFTILADCGPGTGDDFNITYYLDDAGGTVPGSLHAGPFNVGAAAKIATGVFIATGIGPIAEYAFTATHAPVAVTSGECYWIEIQNNTTGNCFWLWSTAPAGDGAAAQNTAGGPPPHAYVAALDEIDYDLAYCLDVTIGATGCAGFCGDGTCDPSEDSCNCPADCGPPTADEVGLCANGLDDDCDTFVDCADSDCAADPACLPPPNDNCVDRITLPGDGVYPYTTANATTDGNAHLGCMFDGQTYEDIWYNYVAVCNGDLTISTCNEDGGDAGYDTDLVVYGVGDTDCSGIVCPPTDLEMIACNDDATTTCTASGTDFASRIVIPVTAGNCYKIRVGGWNPGDEGPGDLSVNCLECGDGLCEATEDQCNCPADCGTPPATETSCTDGVDNDCDTFVDCDDTDCPLVANEGAGTCNDGLDNDCDGSTDCFDPDCLGIDGCPSTPIPTMTEWGVIVMVMLLLSAGTIVFARRRRVTA